MSGADKGFQHAILATDIVIFAIKEGSLCILLVKMQKEHFRGYWAVPGGLINPSEPVEACARRNLLKAANADDVYLEQLYTFGEVDRDPHGRVVSVSYYALMPDWRFHLSNSTEYNAIEWFSIDDLPELAYDHDDVVLFAIERLRSKLTYSNIIFNLMPDTFTLSELQRAYEVVLNKKLDKRNFRKKILSLNQIASTGRRTVGKAHRPADLYRFKRKTVEIIQVL